MTTSRYYYTIADMEGIRSCCSGGGVSVAVERILRDLESSLQVRPPPSLPPQPPQPPPPPLAIGSGGGLKAILAAQGGQSCAGSWKAPRLKATVIIDDVKKKDPLFDMLQTICVSLNKMTLKNYDTHRDIVLAEVDKCGSAEDAVSEVVQKVVEAASRNRGSSALYAQLLRDLLDRAPAARGCVDRALAAMESEFQSSFHAIEFVDPNVDYDGFCVYNKKNERRKALALFLVHLSSREVFVRLEHVMSMIRAFQTLLLAYIELEQKTSEVEEIVETLFLFVTHLDRRVCCGAETWTSDIVPRFAQFSTFKAKDFPSLSSRAVFKSMDILDFIQKPQQKGK